MFPILRMSMIFVTDSSIAEASWSSDSEKTSLISESFKSMSARFCIFKDLSASRNCRTDANRFPPFICLCFPNLPSSLSDWNFPSRTYCWFFWLIRYSDKDANPSVVCWRALQVSSESPSFEVSLQMISQSLKARKRLVLSIKFSDVIASWSSSLFLCAKNLLLTLTIFHQLLTISRNSAVSRKAGWPRFP